MVIARSVATSEEGRRPGIPLHLNPQLALQSSRSLKQQLNHTNERKPHEAHSPLPKPIALSQELQTKSCHSHPTDAESEPGVPTGESLWRETATANCPLAQKQSARLISERPRSVTARDNQPRA